MKIIEDRDKILVIWNKLQLGRDSYGVTGCFYFREFYASLCDMKSVLVCDSEYDPTYVLPLSKSKNAYTLFGTTDLEDPVFMVREGGQNSFLDTMHVLNVSPIWPRLNAKQVSRLRNLNFLIKEEITGVKVIVDDNQSVSGSGHFSERNILRAEKRISSLDTEWFIKIYPTKAQLQTVFENSIGMFQARGKISKLANYQRQKKYLSLYTSKIVDVLPYIAICNIDNEPAIYVLFLFSHSVATVSTVAINPKHIQSKILNQWGFKYTIGIFSKLIKTKFKGVITDFQGGVYNWKAQVNPNCQLSQSTVTFYE